MITFSDIVTFIASGCMIIGGTFAYIPQYREIRSTNNADGFSLYVCLTLLVANILRVLFWFGHPFELPLLIQSIVMIVTMFVMVQLCTWVKSRNEIVASRSKKFTDTSENVEPDKATTEKQEDKEKTDSDTIIKIKHKFTDFNWSHFWQWTDFSSYVQCMIVFTFVVALVTWLFIKVPVYVEGLGFLAVLFEALLGAPQFYRNFENKSTRGMSVSMVLIWTLGDVFKTIYFILRAAPLQFWLCGLLQVSLDFAIMLQVGCYSS